MRRMALRVAVIGLVGGGILMGVSVIANYALTGFSPGLPVPYAEGSGYCRPVTFPFKGCQLSYNPWIAGLDFLFWFGIASFLSLLAIALTTPSEAPEATTL
jgi:hypothetical protein